MSQENQFVYDTNHFNVFCNQEQARAMVSIFNARDFEMIEACKIVDQTFAEVLEKKPYDPGSDDKEAILKWMDEVSAKHNHKPGENYIYFRLICLPF
jgi:hypothetical protein